MPARAKSTALKDSYAYIGLEAELRLTGDSRSVAKTAEGNLRNNMNAAEPERFGRSSEQSEVNRDGRQPRNLAPAPAALFPDSLQDSELGPIPKCWSARRLPDAIEVNPRRTLKAGTVEPCLEMKNLPTQCHSAEGVIDREFSSGSKFQNGETLLARIAPCLENGKTGNVDFLEDGQVGWGSSAYIVLSPKPPRPPQFGYLLARSGAPRSHAIQNMTGTSGGQCVPSEFFNTFWLAVPPPDIAERFDNPTAPLMAKIKANADQSRTQATLRDSLLPKLLSGELSVQAVNTKKLKKCSTRCPQQKHAPKRRWLLRPPHRNTSARRF